MQACLLYIGTEDGVFVLRWDGDKKSELIGRGLEGNAVRGIAVHPQKPQSAYVACGLRGWGLHRTQDAGRSFHQIGFEDRWVWDVAFPPAPAEPKALYVGTEPPMLYVSHDNGRTFEAFEGIAKLPSRPRWKFFYEPFYAGHVHGIALHPERPERVFAGAGEGLYISEDAGWTWEPIPTLQDKYVHAICFDPRRSEWMYVYVAEDGAPLYRSEDGGRSWRAIGKGLPAARPADSVSLHPRRPTSSSTAGTWPPARVGCS